MKSRASYVRFHAVCKSWFGALDLCNKPLPWVIKIKIKSSECVCNLYEPCSSSNRSPTLVYNHHFNIATDENVGTLKCVRTSVQRHGWVICLVEEVKSHSKHLCLFSPFTKKVIQLPKLPYFQGSRIFATFSTEPNDRDCVFLVLYDDSKKKRITINTIFYQHKRWSSREFDRPDKFDGWGHIPLYISGIFYFVVPFGEVASYNVVRREWKVESFVVEHGIPQTHVDYTVYKVFEFKGEIMLIGIYGDSGVIRKFVRSRNIWVTLKSLSGWSVFCSHQSIVVSTIGTEAKIRGALPNKIYFCDDDQCIVYSIQNGKLAKFADVSGIRSWDNINYIYGNFFESAAIIVKRKHPSSTIRPSLLLGGKNNKPKQTLLPVGTKQQQNDTESGTVMELENRVMDQTGDHLIDDTDDDELENLRVLAQMWRSRN